MASAQSLLADVLLRGGGGCGPVSSYICAPQGAAGLVTQLAAGADFGLGAREVLVCGWEPGPSALEAACLGRPRFTAVLTLTETVRKEDAEAGPCLVGGRSPLGEVGALNRLPHPGGRWHGKRDAPAGSPARDPLILLEGASSLSGPQALLCEGWGPVLCSSRAARAGNCSPRLARRRHACRLLSPHGQGSPVFLCHLAAFFSAPGAEVGASNGRIIQMWAGPLALPPACGLGVS